MPVFRLNPFDCDEKYCFVKGFSIYATRLMRGGEVLPEMLRKGVAKLEYRLDEDEGGLEIGDYFTTTSNQLLVSSRFADAIAGKFDLGRYEFVPARVKNEKGRIHVPDMVVINPIEAVDCLDWEASDVDADADNPMVGAFGAWRLKESRIPPGRDLFRVKGLIGYLFSERLVEFIRQEGFKNFAFEPAVLS